MNRPRRPPRLLLPFLLIAAAPAHAWDPVSVLNGAIQGQVNREIQRGVGEALRSVIAPVTGKALPMPQGAQGAAGLPDGNNIVVYSANWCPRCREALAYLNSRNIAYIHNDIEHNPVARAQYDELVRSRQARGVPMIFVGGETLNGWSVPHFEGMRSRLETRLAASRAATPPPPDNAAQEIPRDALAAGSVLIARIPRVRLLAEAQPRASVLGQLGKHEEVVYLGESQGRYLRVQGAEAEGWVDRTLLDPAK